MNWVILGSAGGGVTVMHIDTNQGMKYAAAQRLADEINAMYAVQQSVQRTADHAADCAINVGMLGECDCGAED